MCLKSLSVINFIRIFVEDFYCDIVDIVNNRKYYVKDCRSMVKRVEQFYLDSSTIDDFIIKLYGEVLLNNNTLERSLFCSLIDEIKRLRKYNVYCS